MIKNLEGNMEERDHRENKGRIGGILLIDGPTDNGIQMVPGRRASKEMKAPVYESIPLPLCRCTCSEHNGLCRGCNGT